MTGDLPPESGRMIHVQAVAELVNEYIFYCFRVKKKELGIQADGALAGAACPSGFLGADLNP